VQALLALFDFRSVFVVSLISTPKSHYGYDNKTSNGEAAVTRREGNFPQSYAVVT